MELESSPEILSTPRAHNWLRPVRIYFSPGPMDPPLESFVPRLLRAFSALGHAVLDHPDDRTDAIFTTARYGEPLSWRESLLFTGRRKFSLNHSPTIFTLLHLSPEKLASELRRLEAALAKDPPDPADYRYPGMADSAYRVLHEQGRRGGPIMAFERLVQSQAKCIRNLVIVGDEEPERVYHFDLVGAHPASLANGPRAFYPDIVTRVVTTLSTHEITDHTVVGHPIPAETWGGLHTPTEMKNAARELGKRNFFTEMVVIARLVNVPAISDSVASQYSEGCFATWDPEIQGLIATVTGSAKPVDKGSITEDDLAVIVGVREDGRGAVVRRVLGKKNDPPSSEAVEMMGMDSHLPRIHLPTSWKVREPVPVIRSKLHGHRGVSSFDPTRVEYVRLDPPYYHYPVSCATEAQARGIIQAFSRSQSLQDPEDPRQVAFTVLPGHGVVITEKWVPGKAPFQAIWEMMDDGALQIARPVPQGYFRYVTGPDEYCHLVETDRLEPF